MIGARRISAAAILVAALTACGSSDLPYIERPPEVLYNLALDAMEEGEYEDAAANFDEVERQHPYSVWATKAQLMAAFANYQDNEYVDAVSAAERFIALHPGHRDAAYAYYLIAISYYEQISDVGRDQFQTELALKSLSELVRRFPSSDYARDARLKIDLTRDHLAGKQMEIGRFYLGRGHYVAAINRFRTVVEEYQTTTHTAEALHRLAEAYLALGVTEEAQTAGAVLGYNYPNSDWYEDTYKLLSRAKLKLEADDESWLLRAWDRDL